MPPLLDDQTLGRSDVVANASMNRQRGIRGVNSYSKELSFDPLGFLNERLQRQDTVAWLDLCCGTGKALIQAAEHFQHAGVAARVRIIGVDLVSMFDACPAIQNELRLEAASLTDWEPDRRYELITCVHGLHYLGDKLRLLQRVPSWLVPDGLFLAHLDLANLRLKGKKSGSRSILSNLRAVGFDYRPKPHLIRCSGGQTLLLPYTYLGADDQAGPNFTHQPAVDSWYAEKKLPLVNG